MTKTDLTNQLLGFNERDLRLNNRPLSQWKQLLRNIPRNSRRSYFFWRFRYIAHLANVPVEKLPEWDQIYCYLRVMLREYFYDGGGI